MNKKIVIILTIAILLVIGITYYIFSNVGSTLISVKKLDNNMSATKKAVIVNVTTNDLWVMEPDNYNDLIQVTFSDNGNSKFKQGQEILIYYNKEWQLDKSLKILIMNVGKIEILEEKSGVEIPKDMLIACYNSKKQIEIFDVDIKNNSIEYKIKDTNDYPYEFSENYELYKVEKNEENENKQLIFYNNKNDIKTTKLNENTTSYNYNFDKIEERKLWIYNLWHNIRQMGRTAIVRS